MSISLFGLGGNLFRGEADAFINDFHAASSGPRRDLFSAIGMAIKPWLAKHIGKLPAECIRERFDAGFHGCDVFVIPGGNCECDAGGPAKLTENLAQGRTPFARRDASFGTGNGRLHNVAAFGGGGFEIGDGRSRRHPHHAPCARL